MVHIDTKLRLTKVAKWLFWPVSLAISSLLYMAAVALIIKWLIVTYVGSTPEYADITLSLIIQILAIQPLVIGLFIHAAKNSYRDLMRLQIAIALHRNLVETAKKGALSVVTIDPSNNLGMSYSYLVHNKIINDAERLKH